MSTNTNRPQSATKPQSAGQTRETFTDVINAMGAGTRPLSYYDLTEAHAGECDALRERVALLEGALRYCIERGHSPDVDNGCVQAVALLRSLGETP